MKEGMRARSARSASCSSGYSARYLSAELSSRAVVSCPAQLGQHVAPRVLPAVFDVLGDELAPAAGQRGVKLLVGQAPHELLVLLEPGRRHQPHQQRALAGVPLRASYGEGIVYLGPPPM
jgi:hypothetical protein